MCVLQLIMQAFALFYFVTWKQLKRVMSIFENSRLYQVLEHSSVIRDEIKYYRTDVTQTKKLIKKNVFIELKIKF